MSDIGPLSGLVGIEVLTLFENSISDIEPLRGMTSLNELHLGGNFISDIEPLSELTTWRYCISGPTISPTTIWSS